jgi:hypothetical protein
MPATAALEPETYPAETCLHARTRFERMPEGSGHFGRTVCSDCGFQLSCVADPRNISKRAEGQSNIRKLLRKNVTDYERGFLDGINHNRISPAHRAVLQGLVRKYLLKGDCNDKAAENKDARSAF